MTETLRALASPFRLMLAFGAAVLAGGALLVAGAPPFAALLMAAAMVLVIFGIAFSLVRSLRRIEPAIATSAQSFDSVRGRLETIREECLAATREAYDDHRAKIDEATLSAMGRLDNILATWQIVMEANRVIVEDPVRRREEQLHAEHADPAELLPDGSQPAWMERELAQSRRSVEHMKGELETILARLDIVLDAQTVQRIDLAEMRQAILRQNPPPATVTPSTPETTG